MDPHQDSLPNAVYPERLDPQPPAASTPTTDEHAEEYTLEDSVIAGLESLCSIFDNVYLFKSLGIISEENFLYRRLNKGEWGSKLWFVTLVLSARKSASRFISVVNTRSKLKKEMQRLKVGGDEDLVKQVLRNKFSDALKKCGILIRDLVLELLQTLAYLAIVIIEVFKVSVNDKVLRILEPLSHFITVVRMLTSGYTSLIV